MIHLSRIHYNQTHCLIIVLLKLHSLHFFTILIPIFILIPFHQILIHNRHFISILIYILISLLLFFYYNLLLQILLLLLLYRNLNYNLSHPPLLLVIVPILSLFLLQLSSLIPFFYLPLIFFFFLLPLIISSSLLLISFLPISTSPPIFSFPLLLSTFLVSSPKFLFQMGSPSTKALPVHMTQIIFSYQHPNFHSFLYEILTAPTLPHIKLSQPHSLYTKSDYLTNFFPR